MTRFEQEKWQARYASLPSGPLSHKPPAQWLHRWNRVIPRGRVVDLAIGLGGNAFYLAAQGASVLGIDISERAVRVLRRTALDRGLRIEFIVADLDVFPLPVDCFEAVLCFFYLNRRLFPQIKNSLKPGGVFLMEAFVTDPQRPDKDQPSYRSLQMNFSMPSAIWKFSTTARASAKHLRPPSQPRPAFAPGSPDRPPKAVGHRNAGWPRPYLRVGFQTGFRAGCQQVADRQEGLSRSGADRLQDEVDAETNDFFVPQRVSIL